MKQNIFLLLSLCIMLFSCSDNDDPIKDTEKPPVENNDPFITLNKTAVNFTNEGGSEGIAIKSNIVWTTKSSASWCTLSQSGGDVSTKTIAIVVTENESYDDRSCEVTIEGGDITKTIAVNQNKISELLVTQDKYELSSEESTIEVELKANVDFDIEISDNWITRVETRGLTTTILIFDIAENMSYENRQDVITINQKNGDLSSTIKVHQSKRDKWEDQNRAAFNKIAASSEYQTIQSKWKNESIAYKVIKNGDGVSPLYTDRVRVLYTGWFKRVDWNKGDTFINEDGVKVQNKYIFDSTANRNDVPSVFQVSGVIDGFSTALKHMKVGEKWEVWMPAELGYGATSQSSIPTNTTLVFEIELLEVL